MGGGAIFVPALYYLLPFTGMEESSVPYFAISISLFAGAIAASFAGSLYLYADNVDKKKALLFAIGSSSAAFVSAIYVTSVDPGILKVIFAVVLFVMAINMFLDTQLKRKPQRINKLNDYILVVIGLSVGILSVFTGLGGGIIFFPVLHYLFLLNTKKAIGTSSVISAMTMIFASLSFYINRSEWTGNYQLVDTYLFVAAPLGFGAVLGARIGFNFVLKLSSALVKKIFSVLLIIVVVKIILSL